MRAPSVFASVMGVALWRSGAGGDVLLFRGCWPHGSVSASRTERRYVGNQ